jgi:hypothetical protein
MENTWRIKMQHIKKLFLAITLTVLHLCFITKSFASGYLTIDNGYRYDRIDETLAMFNPSTLETEFAIADQEYKNLSSYVLGGHGLWDIWRFLTIKASGHYSWTTHGNFTQIAVISGSLKGHMIDVSGGAGVPFCLGGVRFIFFGGYGYDEQNLTIQNVQSTNPAASANEVDGSRWKTKWFGPWVGADLEFSSLCFCKPLLFRAGYEFHFGEATKKFNIGIADPTEENFNYHAHFRNALGNVFNLEALYPFWCNWVAGVKVQYTYWWNCNQQRDSIPGPAESGLAPGLIQSTDRLSWFSFLTTINVGLIF